MGSSPRRNRACAVALAACLLAGGARAQHARLATSPGDGGVTVDVDAYGAFGYQTYGNGQGGVGDALYDPVGAVGPSSTTWQAGVYLRMPPSSTFLSIGTIGATPRTGSLPDPGFDFQDGTTARSTFLHAGLDWELEQSVQDLVVGPRRVGTMLVQRYVIFNSSAATIAFDLVRYYEGDLYLGLGAGVPDGGGRLVVGAEEVLFETDLAGEPAATTNLVGITACGGVAPARGRYEVNAWSAFPGRIHADLPLGDVVFNDGPDADEFVDAGLDYDVGLALANQFSLGPGQVASYVTTTVFGQLPPEDVSQGCAFLTRAVADAGPDQVACPGALVTLDGTGSADGDIVPGGLAETWTWDLDVTTDTSGNGVPDDDADATGSVVSRTFPPGTTVVKLAYTDEDGDSATDLVTITIEDGLPPFVDCPAEILADATSWAGGPASPVATAIDDCDAAPVLRNDRTGGGADASDDYPCGATRVTFTATDATGHEGSCTTTVRIVPGSTSFAVGAALRVSKRADDGALLDWSLVGAVPPEVPFSVLRGELREAPTAIAPTGANLAATAWADPEPGGPLVFFNVRSVRCDGSLSPD